MNPYILDGKDVIIMSDKVLSLEEGCDATIRYRCECDLCGCNRNRGNFDYTQSQ